MSGADPKDNIPVFVSASRGADLMKTLAENPHRCRVQLTDSGAEFTVHSIILSSSSEVFRAIVNEHRDFDQPIQLPGIDTGTFLMIMNFMYHNICEISLDNVVDLLHWAIKYRIDKLVTLCEGFWSGINPSNTDFTITSYLACVKKNYTELLEHCWRRITFDAVEVLEHPNIQNLPIAFMMQLVQIGDVRCSDQQLLDGIDRWKQHKPDALAEQINGIRSIVTTRMEDRTFRRSYGGLKLNCRLEERNNPTLYFTGTLYARRNLHIRGVGIFTGLTKVECQSVRVNISVYTDQQSVRGLRFEIPLSEDPFKVQNCFFEQTIPLLVGESFYLKAEVCEVPYRPNRFWHGMLRKGIHTLDARVLEVECEDTSVYGSPVASILYS